MQLFQKWIPLILPGRVQDCEGATTGDILKGKRKYNVSVAEMKSKWVI
jgi:hypothetical protein